MLYTACMPKQSERPLKVARRPIAAKDDGSALKEADAEFLAGVGAAVREARSQRGMSRKALALSAGVSERYLAHVESYGGNPSIVFLRRVASALGMQLLTLL